MAERWWHGFECGGDRCPSRGLGGVVVQVGLPWEQWGKVGIPRMAARCPVCNEVLDYRGSWPATESGHGATDDGGMSIPSLLNDIRISIDRIRDQGIGILRGGQDFQVAVDGSYRGGHPCACADCNHRWIGDWDHGCPWCGAQGGTVTTPADEPSEVSSALDRVEVDPAVCVRCAGSGVVGALGCPICGGAGMVEGGRVDDHG
uniref:Uncharacterized protein n=1 Tax=viral metagenome TaxID=1070528 RepID=A0A6M3L249_9ZZZZ